LGGRALARRARATMVIRLGRPRVRGIVHGDLLEVEVPLDTRRDDVAERIRDAQQPRRPGRKSHRRVAFGKLVDALAILRTASA
jgi:hypothetical protein